MTKLNSYLYRAVALCILFISPPANALTLEAPKAKGGYTSLTCYFGSSSGDNVCAYKLDSIIFDTKVRKRDNKVSVVKRTIFEECGQSSSGFCFCGFGINDKRVFPKSVKIIKDRIKRVNLGTGRVNVTYGEVIRATYKGEEGEFSGSCIEGSNQFK